MLGHKRVWDAEEEYGDVEEVLEGVGKPYLITAELRDIVHQGNGQVGVSKKTVPLQISLPSHMLHL
jgi:hypothetical protein